MSNALEDAKAEAAAQKARASRASEDLLRAQREIGQLRDNLEQIGTLEAANDQLKAENADLKSRVKALETAVKAADAKVAENAAKVAAAEQIAAGIKAL